MELNEKEKLEILFLDMLFMKILNSIKDSEETIVAHQAPSLTNLVATQR
jgi:hypothetical protein